MSAGAEAPRPLGRIWIMLALAFTALCIIQGGHQLWWSSGLPTGVGQIGYRADPSCAPANFCPITEITPGGPAERAGLRAGDRVRRETFTIARPAIGQSVPLLVEQPGGARRLVLAADPMPPLVIPDYILATVLMIFAAVMGGLVIARSGGRQALVLIGLAYASFAITGQWPRVWQNLSPFAPSFYVILSVIYYGSPLLFLAGARALRREVSGRDPVSIRLGFWALVVGQGAILAYQLSAELQGQRGLFNGNAFLAYTIPVFIGYALAAGVLALTWRESPPHVRSRYGMLLIAISTTFLSGVFDMGILLTGNNYTTVSPLLVGWYIAFGLGAALFAYAILRHKVVDLGFAVNRTLVFGALSSALLFAFFFLEWGAEQVIPAHMREANLLVSAGIAFALFITFHKLKHWVEHGIETLFFRRWRDNEAKLRRFLKDAGYVTRADALRIAALAELKRFSGGAGVALYALKDEALLRDGDLGGAPAAISIDAPALVRMRADREPLDGDLAATVGGALVLPVIQRAEVTGFFVVGAKPSDEAWRPDEQALLVEAAQKIGQDLHALEIERLEQQVGELQARLTGHRPGRRSRAPA